MNFPEKIHKFLRIKSTFANRLGFFLILIFIFNIAEYYFLKTNTYLLDLFFLYINATIIIFISVMIVLFRFSKWQKNDPNHRAMPFITQFFLVFIGCFVVCLFFIDLVLSENPSSSEIFRNLALLISSLTMLGNYRIIMFIPLKERVVLYAGIASQQGMKYAPYEENIEKYK